MEISANLVKDLREKTGAGMMDCKKALTEAEGDFEKAIEFLRKKGMAAASKKAGRATKDGVVSAIIEGDGRFGALYEINCETDFVARTEQFKNFVKEVGAQISKTKPESAEALLTQAYYQDSSKTMDVLLKELIATLGENMAIRRCAVYQAPTTGCVTSYIHGEGKVGVLVEFAYSNPGLATQEAFKAYSKDIAMQIAAASPQYVTQAEVPADVLAKEKEIAIEQMKNQGKPAEIAVKAAEGKVKKFYEEFCLVNQLFVKDQGKTIAKVTDEIGKQLGATISIKRFARYQLGDGVRESV